MRRHAGDGAGLLFECEHLRWFAPVVGSHHERLDGSGYPSGLCGKSISLVTRIVSVADAFHAMIGSRVYRASLQPGEALFELESGAGTLWDRNVLAALRTVLGANSNPDAERDRSGFPGLGLAFS
jgi:HD-GYP domain-containing protein (c-di-GMP phosphodiesterase class II)